VSEAPNALAAVKVLRGDFSSQKTCALVKYAMGDHAARAHSLASLEFGRSSPDPPINFVTNIHTHNTRESQKTRAQNFLYFCGPKDSLEFPCVCLLGARAGGGMLASERRACVQVSILVPHPRFPIRVRRAPACVYVCQKGDRFSARSAKCAPVGSTEGLFLLVAEGRSARLIAGQGRGWG